jgi:hypothetical protein
VEKNYHDSTFEWAARTQIEMRAVNALTWQLDRLELLKGQSKDLQEAVIDCFDLMLAYNSPKVLATDFAHFDDYFEHYALCFCYTIQREGFHDVVQTLFIGRCELHRDTKIRFGWNHQIVSSKHGN